MYVPVCAWVGGSVACKCANVVSAVGFCCSVVAGHQHRIGRLGTLHCQKIRWASPDVTPPTTENRSSLFGPGKYDLPAGTETEIKRGAGHRHVQDQWTEGDDGSRQGTQKRHNERCSFGPN